MVVGTMTFNLIWPICETGEHDVNQNHLTLITWMRGANTFVTLMHNA